MRARHNKFCFVLISQKCRPSLVVVLLLQNKRQLAAKTRHAFSRRRRERTSKLNCKLEGYLPSRLEGRERGKGTLEYKVELLLEKLATSLARQNLDPIDPIRKSFVALLSQCL